mmetsp:Transcript_44013/g.131934  ORF Transcript_44013/g.131934 Transcript_44013/m.131934 type:complete len:221 (-) Transcript_44013:1401-2063(-)
MPATTPAARSDLHQHVAVRRGTGRRRRKQRARRRWHTRGAWRRRSRPHNGSGRGAASCRACSATARALARLRPCHGQHPQVVCHQLQRKLTRMHAFAGVCLRSARVHAVEAVCLCRARNKGWQAADVVATIVLVDIYVVVVVAVGRCSGDRRRDLDQRRGRASIGSSGRLDPEVQRRMRGRLGQVARLEAVVGGNIRLRQVPWLAGRDPRGIPAAAAASR